MEAQAVLNLAPKAEFSITYGEEGKSSINWLSKDIKQPTDKAITKEIKRLAQEAQLKEQKDAINQETHAKIFELLGVSSVEKAKEKQLNANARVSELLANKVFNGALTDAEMLELRGIKTAFTKVQGFLADGKDAKAGIKV